MAYMMKEFDITNPLPNPQISFPLTCCQGLKFIDHNLSEYILTTSYYNIIKCGVLEF